jgi:hypothetical protein
VALVDEEDFERVNQYKWYANKVGLNWYAVRVAEDNSSILLHRFILGLESGDSEVDHINGDGLDCRKANLRLCTHSQNMANREKPKTVRPTSQYKGVYYKVSERKWVAQIMINYKHKYLGSFKNEEDAARAYDTAAVEAWGEFARINFP